MKKMFTHKKSVIVLIVALSCILCSCMSTIPINTWMPSEVDLSGVKTVAINTVSINDSFDYNYRYASFPTQWNYPVPSQLRQYRISPYAGADTDISQYATRMLEKALNQGVYNVIDAKNTSSLIKSGKYMGMSARDVLLSASVDAVITASIDSLDVDDYISCIPKNEKNGDSTDTVYYYYLNQRYYLKMSYMVQNVKTLAIIDSGVLEGSYPSDGRSHTVVLIGKGRYLDKDGDGKKEFFEYIPSIDRIEYKENIFAGIIDDFYTEMRDRLTPHQRRSYISLISNRTDSPFEEQAMSMVYQGLYSEALAVYSREYSVNHDLTSGYNAAVLYFALGDYEKALSIAQDVVVKSYGYEIYPKAVKLCKKLVQLKENQDKAMLQMNSSGYGKTNNDLIGF